MGWSILDAGFTPNLVRIARRFTAEDAAISKFDLLVERKEVQIEKLDLAEPGVRQKLAAAQALARQQRLRKLQGDYAAAAAAFISSARKTVAAHAALVAIAETGRLSGLERELATLAVAPNIGGTAICAPDLLDLFESALAGPPPAPVRAAAAKPGRSPAPRRRSRRSPTASTAFHLPWTGPRVAPVLLLPMTMVPWRLAKSVPL